ncbi:MAG: phosphoglycerate dehydrogenase [Candidatus Rokubacteria bacterium]|nr:phosphoglycerate dehydrogenase [Candidatus Rokubacteria bacterium]
MKIYVTGAYGPSQEFDSLRELGHEVVLGRPVDQPGRQPYTEEELVEWCRDADVIMASHLDTITRPVLEAAERLRLVVVPYIGVDKIDVGAATELGIVVANSPTPQNFHGVAEATIAFMLMLLKRIKRNEAKLRRGEWAQRLDRGWLLSGKTIGLVGFGRVSTQVARRLQGWDVRLLACDPYVAPEAARPLRVTLVPLTTLLMESNVVSLHATLTAKTRNMIGEKELRSMKRTAFLINTARGELVDENALYRAIDESWIAGAALDVFEQEPLPMESRLRRLDPERVILTPHNASHTEAGRLANLKLALESTLSAVRGEVPKHTVNPPAAARWRERFGPTKVGGLR